MSVSVTEKYVAVSHWATAKVTPQTMAGNQVCRMPRLPSTMNTSASGTNSARIGVWWPTRAPSLSSVNRSACWGSAPVVTADSVTIGVASAPNATGAVLATSASTAALSGRKPSAMSMTLVIATGVPKPASASSSAPKQNAMMMPWIRMSSLTVLNDRRSTSKCPVSTVML